MLLLICPFYIHGPIHLLPFHLHYELTNHTQRYNLGSKNTRLLMNDHSQALHFCNQFRIAIKHIIVTIFVMNRSKVIMDLFHCKIFWYFHTFWTLPFWAKTYHSSNSLHKIGGPLSLNFGILAYKNVTILINLPPFELIGSYSCFTFRKQLDLPLPLDVNGCAIIISLKFYKSHM